MGMSISIWKMLFIQGDVWIFINQYRKQISGREWPRSDVQNEDQKKNACWNQKKGICPVLVRAFTTRPLLNLICDQ